MPSFSPSTPLISVAMKALSLLDVHVDAGGQVDAHQRVDRLRCRVEDVDQSLVRPHLEVLAAVLVLVRRPDDAVDVLLRRQRHGSDDPRAGAGHRVDDLPRGRVDRLMVVGLEPDADLLSRHGVLLGVCALPGCTERSRPQWARSTPAHWRTARYLRILMTRPAPTVRPPSRIANRR